MKKFTCLLALSILLFAGCEKELELNEEIAVYDYDSLDENAGAWDPVYLGKASDIPLAAPLASSTPEYKAEVDALKKAGENLTQEQQNAIQFWGANPLVRWNEIARGLVAKYNLPPAANPDGTYPVPSAANPGAYPNFPFANPPYASRAYAYWSAAQFDALVVAWKYKKDYNRVAPYVADPSLKTALPKVNLPSYPSEDAVIAAVSREILTFMFPLEAAFLKKMAEEQVSVRTWAGMNVRSDLEAGEAIGKAVAALFLTRARTDNMGRAVGNQAIWDSLANIAIQKYGWQWQSQESPKRPGMLTGFGQVKPWCVPNIEAVRPGPPPALNSPQFQAAMEELKKLDKNLTTEQRRIANYWGDGVSTYTPPGHWNKIASEIIIEKRLNPIRTARTYAYLNMSLMDAGISCWDTKYFYYYPRPSQAIPGFKSILGLPNFPSYTSGHSTFSAAAATVLGHIFPDKAAEMDRMAREASESRIYGGIHYRFDCEVGLAVGRKIGDYSVVVARVDGAE